MASTSSAAASTSSTAADSNHDVFISHRGPDVNKTFASYLYQRLRFHGITAFLDKPELQPGEKLTSQVEGAIRSASVHVAIFSSGYADSVWCLNELLLMLESKSPIIPVFYKDVEPADLRWKRGIKRSYAEALEELEKKTSYDPKAQEFKPRYASPTIEKWRDALYRVSMISGFELAAFDGDEGELLNKVVDGVLKMVGKPALDVADYPTGLDDKVKDFENSVLLQHQSGKPHAFGIVGLGGVGKTTLATELFNRKKLDFSRPCILFDVRENAVKGTLNLLQTQLCKCLTGLDKPIVSVREGKGILRKHISSCKVFLILDDVDHIEHIYAFLPQQADLHPDSLVLITSRNKDVLRSAGVEESSIYNLTGLSTQHSLELFCLHSFNQPYPPQEFESLVDKFGEACAGLPLSLRVVGALLKGKGLVYWEDQLKKFKRMLPQGIEHTLRISYDALDEEEKTIFLDIACFFIGEDRDMVIRIWDGGVCGFQNLQSKCLVEVDDQNKIKMHDHLRDLGRNIDKASTPRRLWRPIEKEDDDLLQQSSVINDQVRGIKMLRSRDSYFDDSSEMPFHGTAISLKNLQLVHTEGDLLERILRRSDFSNLLWLRWDNCPYSSLPSWISMKNLRVLQVQGSELETLWRNESQVPVQLRGLKIIAGFSTGQLNIPKSIGQLKNLERIVISPKEQYAKMYFAQSMNVKLTKLPEEFCLLESLKALVLIGCSEMKSLPERFGNLTNLQHIDLRGCIELERLPDSFGQLVKLQYLNLERCWNLTMSSETLGNIRTLEYMNLSDCSKIKVFPPQVAHQSSLQQLRFRSTALNIKELPSTIGELGYLKVLEIGGGPLLEMLPPSVCSLKNLKELGLYECDQLKCLPDSLGDLRSLMKLAIYNCKELKCLPASTGQLTQLTELSIKCCRLIEELPFIKEVKGERETSSDLESSSDNCILPRLQRLSVDRTGISEVSFAQGVCFNLRDLSMRQCDNLIKVGSLPNSLIQVNFGSCQKLRKIEICGLAKLQSLILDRCGELEELAHIETLVSLKKLDANGCVKLKSIRGLGQLANFRTLRVGGCSELEEVDGIQHCLSLDTLFARGCVKLKSIRGLGQLAKLKDLDISGCSELEDLEGIQHCVSLHKVSASGFVKLKSIRGLGQLAKLRYIDISGCSELEEVDGIQHCLSLDTLDASGCVKLKSIRGLGQLAKLKFLHISWCSELEDLEGIQHCVSLYSLKASGCVKLKSIRGLGQLAKLKVLHISGCSELEDLEGIQHCVSLYSLKASGCVKLKSIGGLGRLQNLRYVYINGCSELEEVEGIQHCVSLSILDKRECPKLQLSAGVVEHPRQRRVLLET